MSKSIQTYTEYKEWIKKAKETPAPASSPSGAATPKASQNTSETGVWGTDVTDFHDAIADMLLDYVFITSMTGKALYVLDKIKTIQPSEKSLFLEVTSTGYYKVKPGLPPEEYKKLVGSKVWSEISSKYESEKYLVYDNTAPQDPATGLYPEFHLMFRESPYIKFGFTTVEGDSQPAMTIDFKSDKEYNTK